MSVATPALSLRTWRPISSMSNVCGTSGCRHWAVRPGLDGGNLVADVDHVPFRPLKPYGLHPLIGSVEHARRRADRLAIDVEDGDRNIDRRRADVEVRRA